MIKWIIKEQDEAIVGELTEKGIHPVLSRLMYNRGFRDFEAVSSFLKTDVSDLYSPFLLPDLKEACLRIKKAIADKEKITIYGDYDVDGITSVVILFKYLKSCGVNAEYYIPDRQSEGYGLNFAALDAIKDNGTSLVISVDTGTTAVAEVEYALKSGIDILITDHHECGENIPACLVVNPKRQDSSYPFKELAGVGVVFKLLCALENDAEKIMAEFGGLTAIGTVADIMPLTGENRIIVSNGIKALSSPSAGLRALLSASGSSGEVDTGVIAYRLAPRLNAAGRIGSPSVSVDVLLSEDYSEALRLSEILCEENDKRRQIEADILASVEKIIEQRGGKVFSKRKLDNIIVEASEGWHHGVIGIVASRLVEKYCRPCILFCFDGEKAKGSARSIKGVNMFELLQANSGKLIKFGGHEMAAGLTLSCGNFDAFREDLISYANKNIDSSLFVHTIEAECYLECEDLSLILCEELKVLEPCGSGNPSPLFAVKNMKIAKIEGVSKNKHTRFTFEIPSLSDSYETLSAMYFGRDPSELSCHEGDFVDIICTVGENNFRGNTSLSLIVRSMKLDSETESKINEYSEKYNNIKKNGIFPEDEDILLSRDEVSVLYKYIKRQSQLGIERFSPVGLCRRMLGHIPDFNLCKLRLCLDIFSELGLFNIIFYSSVAVSEDILVKISAGGTKKTDLNNSPTFRAISREAMSSGAYPSA